MGGPPKRQPVVERYGVESCGTEYVDILTPLDLSVKAPGTVPVMISRSNENTNGMKPLKRRLEEGRRVRRESIVLVEVAAAENGVRTDLQGQVHDLQECVTQRLASLPGCQRRAGDRRERAIEMQVCKMYEFHCEPGLSGEMLNLPRKGTSSPGLVQLSSNAVPAISPQSD